MNIVIMKKNIWHRKKKYIYIVGGGGRTHERPDCYLSLLSIFILWLNYYVSDIF